MEKDKKRKSCQVKNSLNPDRQSEGGLIRPKRRAASVAKASLKEQTLTKKLRRG